MDFSGKRMQMASHDQMKECFELYHPSGFLESYGLRTGRPFGLGEGIFVPFDGAYGSGIGNRGAVAHIDFPVLTGGGSDLYGIYSVWLGEDGKSMAVSYEGSTPPLVDRNAPRLKGQRMSADVRIAEDGKATSYNERGFFNFRFPGFGNESAELFETLKRRTG